MRIIQIEALAGGLGIPTWHEKWNTRVIARTRFAEYKIVISSLRGTKTGLGTFR